MKINDVIAQTRALTRGKYEDAQLMEWLSQLDAKIYEDVLMHYEGHPTEPFQPYTDGESELIIPYVFSEVYKNYLDSKIYYSNGESLRYNAASQFFNEAYEDYKDWYRRTHAPLNTNITF